MSHHDSRKDTLGRSPVWRAKTTSKSFLMFSMSAFVSSSALAFKQRSRASSSSRVSRIRTMIWRILDGLENLGDGAPVPGSLQGGRISRSFAITRHHKAQSFPSTRRFQTRKNAATVSQECRTCASILLPDPFALVNRVAF